MGSLGGTGARLAAVCVLLSVATVSCTSSASEPSVQLPVASTVAAPVHMPGGPLPPEPTTPTPILGGCASGTVPITLAGDGGDSTLCVMAGARLRLTLVDNGYGTIDPLQVTPAAAATVAATTDSATGNVHAIVTPTGTAPFCLSAVLNPTTPTPPVLGWHLCVTVRR